MFKEVRKRYDFASEQTAKLKFEGKEKTAMFRQLIMKWNGK